MKTINSNRNFTFNGNKYRIIDTPAADRKTLDDRYMLTLSDDNGLYQSLYNVIGWHIPHFRTIKDAQRAVIFEQYTLDTLY